MDIRKTRNLTGYGMVRSTSLEIRERRPARISRHGAAAQSVRTGPARCAAGAGSRCSAAAAKAPVPKKRHRFAVGTLPRRLSIPK